MYNNHSNTKLLVKIGRFECLQSYLVFRKENKDSSKKKKKEILLQYCFANKGKLGSTQISIAHQYFSFSCFHRNIQFRFSGEGKLLSKSFLLLLYEPLIYLLTCLTESNLVENTVFCCLRVFIVGCHLCDR